MSAREELALMHFRACDAPHRVGEAAAEHTRIILSRSTAAAELPLSHTLGGSERPWHAWVCTFTIRDDAPGMDTRRQNRSIVANFVHSMDASALALTTHAADLRGIRHF